MGVERQDVHVDGPLLDLDFLVVLYVADGTDDCRLDGLQHRRDARVAEGDDDPGVDAGGHRAAATRGQEAPGG